MPTTRPTVEGVRIRSSTKIKVKIAPPIRCAIALLFSFMRVQLMEARTIPAGNPKRNDTAAMNPGVHNLTDAAVGWYVVVEICSCMFSSILCKIRLDYYAYEYYRVFLS